MALFRTGLLDTVSEIAVSSKCPSLQGVWRYYCIQWSHTARDCAQDESQNSCADMGPPWRWLLTRVWRQDIQSVPQKGANPGSPKSMLWQDLWTCSPYAYSIPTLLSIHQFSTAFITIAKTSQVNYICKVRSLKDFIESPALLLPGKEVHTRDTCISI